MTSQREQIVYVVDDDLQMRVAVERLLGSVGLKSECFSSATRFMAIKRANEVSCLIFDVGLSGIRGMDLLLEFTRGQVGLPIIAVSAHADIRTAANAIRRGAVNFLAKPFRDQDLLEAVQEALLLAQAEIAVRDMHERYGTLSRREKQVMKLVCAGLTNNQVATELGISRFTVRLHRQNLNRKLGTRSIVALVRIADALGVGS